MLSLPIVVAGVPSTTWIFVSVPFEAHVPSFTMAQTASVVTRVAEP